MDTPQSPPIVSQTLKRKERSPSPARRTPGHTSTASGSRPLPTSLPSIRHFLPPQPDTAQLNERYHLTNNRQQTGPAFSAGPSAGIPRLDFLPPPPAQPPAEHTHSGIIGDSDGDGDSEQAARPKQKRRRQALSCTECKRRKIKCDRAHPCTPCIRRGDQNKCQWHVIEPVDKYVSRAEYDELKARVDHLEAVLLSRPQLPSGFAPQQGPEPTSSSQAQPKPVGLPSTRLPAAAAPDQHQGCGANSTAPAPVPMPIMPYNPRGLPPPPNSSPVGRTSTTTTATATTTLTTLPSIASLANGPPLHPTGAARLHREHREHEHREQQHQPYAPLPPPQSPLQQQQSLQLQLQQLRLQRMHQDKQQQAKNCHAQTLTPLGERLRCHHRIFLQGPAAIYRLYRLPNNDSNNSSIHRRLRRIIMRGARRGRRTRVPTCRGHPRPERQRSGVQSVRQSENGSRVPIRLWLWTGRNRALHW